MVFLILWTEIWVRVLYGKSNPLLNRRGDGRLNNTQSIYIQFNLLFFMYLCFRLLSSSPSSRNPRARLIFVVLRRKAVVILSEIEEPLCCFARKASVPRHESARIILCCAVQFSAPTQIGDSAGGTKNAEYFQSARRHEKQGQHPLGQDDHRSQ